MDRMLFKFAWLFTLELIIPVWGGGDVMLTLRRTDNRLTRGVAERSNFQKHVSECVQKNCGGLTEEDLLNCLHIHCDQLDDNSQSVVSKEPNLIKNCARLKCKAKQGINRQHCILSECLQGLRHQVKAPPLEHSEDNKREQTSSEERTNLHSWKTGNGQQLNQMSSRPRRGILNDNWMGLSQSGLLDPEDVQYEMLHSSSKTKRMQAQCASSCLMLDLSEDDYQSCLERKCSITGSKVQMPTSRSRNNECVKAKCSHSKPGIKHLLCARLNCAGTSPKHSVAKRWGTRMCMESKCKGAKNKVEYFLCGTTHCHGDS